MHKKIMLACMAIAAFAAFVVAPAASASPVLTSEGVKVPVGTWITAKNTGNTTFTATNGVNVVCSTAHITGTVTNSGTPIEGRVAKGGAQFNGTGAGGDCTSTLGDAAITVNSELCIATVKGKDNVSVTGCTEKVTFTIKVTSPEATCKYVGNIEFGATFLTNAPATVNVVKGRPSEGEDVKLEPGSSFFCPAEGVLDMDFDLYTTSGTQLTIS